MALIPVAALILLWPFLLAAQAVFLAVGAGLMGAPWHWSRLAWAITLAPSELLAAGVLYLLALIALGHNIFPR